MNKHHSCWLVLVALLSIAANAVAQPTLRPGLWEHKFEISSESGRIEAALAQAREMLAALPAEQRQMIERQMAASGINMDLSNYSARVCVSEDQAERNGFPNPNESCSQTVTEQNDNVFKVQFSCEGNPPVTGTGEIRMLSDKEYHGTVTINAAMQGQAERMQATQRGTWISQDCS